MFFIAYHLSGASDAPLWNREVGATGTYVPIIDETIQVESGSSLDVSALRTTAVPAGANGRVRAAAGNARKLEESNSPGAYVTFHVATWQPDNNLHPLPTSRASIDAGVAALAASGYNACRIQGIEYILQDGKTGECVFDLTYLDAFDYFLSALKAAGIYWIFQPFSYTTYRDPQGGTVWHRDTLYPSEKAKMHIEQESRDLWLRGFNLLYNRVNAYTGMNMLQDPALLLVSGLNENAAIFVASAASIPGAPLASRAVGTTKGTAGPTFAEWLADSNATHGYASLAALNTSWGTAYGSFQDAADAMTTRLSRTSNTNPELDMMLYCRVLDVNMAGWFESTIRGLGYVGLLVTTVQFPQPYYLGQEAAFGKNDLWYWHQYAGSVAHEPAIGAAMDNLGQVPLWDRQFFSSTMFAYDVGKPKFGEELGWEYWARYRNQYPIAAAYASMHGVSGWSSYHQGSIFTPSYNTSAPARVRVAYPYDGTAPVDQWASLVSFFALHLGYVSEDTNLAETLVCNPKYVGFNPRNVGRINRAVTDFFTHASRLPAFVRTRFTWNELATDDNWASVYNASSLFDWLDALKVAGAITADNLGYISASANHGSILGFNIATPTACVMQVASHTLVDDDYVSLMSLTGSGVNWPGTSLRTSTYRVTVVDSTHLVIQGLDASTWTGAFSSGAWCESNNITQTANKQIAMSRRHRWATIDAPKMKFAAIGLSATKPTHIDGLKLTAMDNNAAIAVISLDGVNISSSARMLIGIVGEDQNTGTTWDANRETMTAVGNYPIQIRDCTLDITLTNSNARALKLYRLARNGRRAARETPTSVDASSGAVRLNLRTGAIRPSTWFELTV